MSRHRDFRRGIDIDNELSDDVYGRSVEDEYAVSPGTASQYHYKEEQQSLFSFISSPQHTSSSSGSSPPSSETKKQKSKVEGAERKPLHSLTLGSQEQRLSKGAEVADENYEEKALMESGKAYITSVVGTEFSEDDICEALVRCDLSAEIALNELLTQRSLKSPSSAARKPLISFAPIGSASSKATGLPMTDKDQGEWPSSSSSHGMTGLRTEGLSASGQKSDSLATMGLSPRPTLSELIKTASARGGSGTQLQKKSDLQGSKSTTITAPTLLDLIKNGAKGESGRGHQLQVGGMSSGKEEVLSTSGLSPASSLTSSSASLQPVSLTELIKQRKEEKSASTSSSTQPSPLAALIRRRKEEESGSNPSFTQQSPLAALIRQRKEEESDSNPSSTQQSPLAALIRQRKEEKSGLSTSSTQQSPLAALIRQRKEEKSGLSTSSTQQSPLAALIRQKKEEKSGLSTSSTQSPLADLIRQRQQEKNSSCGSSCSVAAATTSASSILQCPLTELRREGTAAGQTFRPTVPSLADLISQASKSGLVLPNQRPVDEVSAIDHRCQDSDDDDDQLLSISCKRLLGGGGDGNVKPEIVSPVVMTQPSTPTAVVVQKVCRVSHRNRFSIEESIALSFALRWQGRDSQTKVQPFSFNTPSPDDLVRQQQQKGFNQHHHHHHRRHRCNH